METTRRRPTQERGKERYQMIIDATTKLVGERGNDDVSIRDIAKQANVAPSSIYQYFHDKNDIIIAIMKDYFDRNYALLETVTSSATTLSEWVNALDVTIENFFGLIKNDPGWATIWSGIQASPVLRDIDNEDAMRNAYLLQSQLMVLCPHVEKTEALSACVMLVQLAAVTAKMALFTDKEMGSELIDEYKRIVRMRIKSIAV